MFNALKFVKTRTLLALVLSLFFVSESVAESLSLEVARAQVSRDLRTEMPIVKVTFTNASRKAFGDFSNSNLGFPVEIRLDGESLMKAVIREPITGGVIHIVNDRWPPEKVNDLAARLSKAGARVDVERAPN